MYLELTELQKEMQEAARTFAKNELAPYAAHWDEEKFFPVDTIKKAAEMGFCGVYTREDVGGMELGRMEAVVIFEELARGCTSTTAYITIHNMVNWMVDQFAKESVRQLWCPKMCAGESLGSYCLTEPNAGSDAGSLKTSAVKKGNKYVLNGSKAFISGSGSTDVFVVMARTGDETTKGISAFVVPADLPGIHFGKNETKLGWNSQPTKMITFEDVEVPEENLLGALGEGFKIAMKGLDGGRINIATCSVGTAQAALKAAQQHMHERKQFGKELASFQALQFKMADMATELVASRQMVRLAAFKLDQKDPDATTYCAMAKRFATDLGFKICNEALQIFGGYGYIREYPLERYFRDVRVHQILEGTNEIMRVIIARRILEDDGPEKIK